MHFPLNIAQMVHIFRLGLKGLKGLTGGRRRRKVVKKG